MRIVVSGTHASGKSTLIADFHARYPQYRVFTDPFDLLDDGDPASERSFAAQLRITDVRLREARSERDTIFERGPLDFVAYLVALERLGRSDGALLARATEIMETAMSRIDLIAVLALDPHRPIPVSPDEDRALRVAMDDALLELIDDLERDRLAPPVAMLTGDSARRLALLSQAVVR